MDFESTFTLPASTAMSSVIGIRMRLLPVIDIMKGRVVRAVQGRRDSYQPWLSPLTPHGDPVDLAHRLRRDFGWTDAYVADLDALTGGIPQFELLTQFAQAGVRLWLDAGTATDDQLARLRQFDDEQRALDAIILALEAIASPETLDLLLQAFPPDKAAFSLDLHDGRPWNTSPAWTNCSAVDIAQIAWTLGVRRLIVLDVARVGTSEGPGTLELCRELKACWPEMELIAGGGVHDGRHIEALAKAGCDRVLVASALHAGRVTALEVLQNGW